MSSDAEMAPVKVKKVKSYKKAGTEEMAATPPVKEKKAKSVDGSSKKKKRKADAEDEAAAAVPEAVRPRTQVCTFACMRTFRTAPPASLSCK